MKPITYRELPMPTEPPLAFIYDRRFTPSRGVLQIRLETCREYAAEMGWAVAGEWVDVDQAALSDDHRPQLDAMTKAMREQAAEGRTVVCLLATWDRLSRSGLRLAAFRFHVAQAGGYTATADGEDDRLNAQSGRELRPR
jgi:Resolvase, N terminal domain